MNGTGVSGSAFVPSAPTRQRAIAGREGRAFRIVRVGRAAPAPAIPRERLRVLARLGRHGLAGRAWAEALIAQAVLVASTREHLEQDEPARARLIALATVLRDGEQGGDLLLDDHRIGDGDAGLRLGQRERARLFGEYDGDTLEIRRALSRARGAAARAGRRRSGRGCGGRGAPPPGPAPDPLAPPDPPELAPHLVALRPLAVGVAAACERRAPGHGAATAAVRARQVVIPSW